MEPVGLGSGGLRIWKYGNVGMREYMIWECWVMESGNLVILEWLSVCIFNMSICGSGGSEDLRF